MGALMKKVLVALAAAASLATPSISATNLISNGDFELGNVGFTSDLTYVAPDANPSVQNELYAPNTYSVGTSAVQFHNAWADYPGVGGTGNYMIINGSEQLNTIWKNAEAIDLGPGTYQFSFYLSDACCNAGVDNGIDPAPPGLWISLNGNSNLLNTTRLTQPEGTPAGTWTKVSAEFTVAAPGSSVFIGIVNDQTAYTGNDFAIDSINLSAVPEASTWAMMLVGFGLAGAASRRRRAVLSFN